MTFNIVLWPMYIISTLLISRIKEACKPIMFVAMGLVGYETAQSISYPFHHQHFNIERTTDIS